MDQRNKHRGTLLLPVVVFIETELFGIVSLLWGSSGKSEGCYIESRGEIFFRNF